MSESSSVKEPSSDLSTLLSSLLSSPDALSKISEIIDRHTNSQNRDIPPQDNDLSVDNDNNIQIADSNTSISKDISPTSQNQEKESPSENPLGFLSLLSSEKLGSLSLKKEQINLLLAVRPYLSEHRRELIDGFIKFSKIAGIFKNFS